MEYLIWQFDKRVILSEKKPPLTKQWDMLLVEVAVAVAKPVSFYNNYKIDCKVNLEA